MNDCESMKPLLMGMMDGELTPEQASAVTRHLDRCEACRREFEELRAACDPLRELVFREPDRERLARLWRTPFSRFTYHAGLLLVLVGWLVLVGYAAVAIAGDNKAELPVKLALAGIVVGFVILFANVLVQRLATWRQDPYKEVER
ncbi:MAG: zf-HC2 domain-containing protein [Lentisphaeria bacterium]|nr:zf-HC2 domain-containing protein [Lentisphaeria bacterium]